MIPAYCCLAGAMLISGSAVVISKMMAGSMPVFLVTELGLAAGLAGLIPAAFFLRREPFITHRRTNAILLLQALCGVVLYRLLIFLGLHYTSAADSGLIASSAPVFVVLLACLFLKEKLTVRRLAGLSLVTAGLVTINLLPYRLHQATGHHSLRGNLLILAAVFCEAVFSVLSKAGSRPMSALYRTTMITVYAFILLLPFAGYDAIRYDWSAFSLSSLICIAYYGIFVSFLSYILWFRGIAKVEAGKAAVFTAVAPFSSIALSALLLKTSVTVYHVAGLLCITAGIPIMVRKDNDGKS